MSRHVTKLFHFFYSEPFRNEPVIVGQSRLFPRGAIETTEIVDFANELNRFQFQARRLLIRNTRFVECRGERISSSGRREIRPPSSTRLRNWIFDTIVATDRQQLALNIVCKSRADNRTCHLRKRSYLARVISGILIILTHPNISTPHIRHRSCRRRSFA